MCSRPRLRAAAGIIGAMSHERAPILITGVSGFIGLHCALAALREGHVVRGGLRHKPGEDRRAKLRAVLTRELGDDPGDRLDFVHVDLLEDAGWDAAVEGCAGVLHVASPVPPGAVANPDALVEPARGGALRLLRAAAASEATRRVVLTSSTAAMVSGHTCDAATIYGPETWSIPERSAAYPRSKVLAERAAWAFVDGLAPGLLELVTIMPGMVYGPVLDAAVYSPSGEPVRKLLRREIPACPNFGWAAVDVRDVAELHVRALAVPEAAGKRFPLGSDHVSMVEIAVVLERHFGPKGYRIPTRRMPNWMVRLAAVFDAQVRLALPELGLYERIDASSTKAVLGWQPRPIDRALIDMGESLIALGMA